MLEEEVLAFLVFHKVIEIDEEYHGEPTAKMRARVVQWIESLTNDYPIQIKRGIEKDQCNRCGAGKQYIHWVSCARCKQQCGYCERCLLMGKCRSCSRLYFFPLLEKGSSLYTKSTTNHLLPTLTNIQNEALDKLIEFYHKKEWKEFLLWAVCGAGKTEVIYPLISLAIERNNRVLWATPRRDVVLELAPRLKRVFPNVSIAVLYGGCENRWSNSNLVLSTTHQALRFYQCFDLVIIDEIDAFPFHNDPMLPYVVSRACKELGKTIYLTATPRESLKKRLKKRINDSRYLPHYKLPVRFHGFPLPVPKIQLESKLGKRIKENKMIPVLQSFLNRLRDESYPGFIFLPSVEALSRLKSYIIKQDSYWNGRLETVHASDSFREEKVMALREGRIQVLLTTTILERGVTIPGISLLVFQGDAPIFDEASLVQIAGRAGRSAQCPTGEVIFLSEDITRGMKGAVGHIKEMNRLARKKGYLHG